MGMIHGGNPDRSQKRNPFAVLYNSSGKWFYSRVAFISVEVTLSFILHSPTLILYNGTHRCENTEVYTQLIVINK